MSRLLRALPACALTICALAAGAGAPAAAADDAPTEALTMVAVAPDHGPPEGGQTVAVTGSGFVADATYVCVDELTVAADVETSERLTFVMPPRDPGTVTLRVIVDDAGSQGMAYVVDGEPAVVASPTPSPRTTGGDQDRDGDPRPSGRAAPRPAPHADEPVPHRQVPDVAAPPELAATGAPTGALAGLAVGAMALGALLVMVARPRRGISR